jgi:hypothetical protein
MALDQSVLAQMMRDELTKLGFDTKNPRKDKMQWLHLFTEALATAVVDHIVQNAEVQTDSGAPDSEHHGIVY